MSQIIPTAEPFFFPASSHKTGCLLIHGLTGTPKEMRGLGEFLSRNGYPTLGVRLAGHATRPRDLIRSRRADWLASVEDGAAMLRDSVEKIILVGLSMGGVLALLSSTRLEGVAGVAALATIHSLPDDPRRPYVNFLSLFLPYVDKTKLPPGSGWFDRAAWKDHISYPRNVLRSLGELEKLLVEMRAALPDVRVPVLLIHSQNDTYVVPENLERIYAALGTADKEKIYLNGSGHVITRDAAREQVFHAVLEFVRRVEAQG